MAFNSGMAGYDVKTTRREVVALYNRVVLGSAGAVASQENAASAGFVVTQTDSEAGRFTVTLSGGAAARLLFVGAIILGADDTAFTDAKGIHVAVRNDDVATDGTFEIQFMQNTDLADDDVQDSLTVLFKVEIQLV